MAFPKNQYFPVHDQYFSQLCLGFGHPARLVIARILYEEGPKYVVELEKRIPLVQASISHHLEKLRELGVVGVEMHGLYNHYYLDVGRLREIEGLFGVWFSRFEMPVETKAEAEIRIDDSRS